MMWLPGYEKIVVSTDRTGDPPRNPQSPPRIVLHTTEGLRIFDYPFPPHFTLALVGDPHSLKPGSYWTPGKGSTPYTAGQEVRQQHCDLDLTSYALLHRAGDPETNHEGSHCVQVEIISMAATPPTWSDGMYGLVASWLADVVTAVPELRPALDNWPEPDKWSARGSYGFTTPFRLRWQEWQDGINGQPFICGHEHVPGNCVSADTPILCADLLWRPAGDLLPGDELIGFDAEGQGNPGRMFRRSIVTHNDTARNALLLVTTSRGPIRVNYEHPFLVRAKNGVGTGPNPRSRWKWVKARDLTPGDQIMYVMEPWQEDRGWESGWLAGIFDGEGSLSISRTGATLAASQRVSDTADRIESAFKQRTDCSFTIKRSGWGVGCTDMRQYQVNDRKTIMRLLGQVRPPRLLAKSAGLWEGKSLGKTYDGLAEVTEVRPYGTGTIARLSTSTHSYIAGGFASHNSHWDPGALNIAKLAGMAKQILGDTPPADEPTPPLWRLFARLTAAESRLNAHNEAIVTLRQRLARLEKP